MALPPTMLIIQFFFHHPRSFAYKTLFVYRVSVYSRQKTEVNEYCNSIDFCFTKCTVYTDHSPWKIYLPFLIPTGPYLSHVFYLRYFFYISHQNLTLFWFRFIDFAISVCTTWNYYETEQVYALSIALYYLRTKRAERVAGAVCDMVDSLAITFVDNTESGHEILYPQQCSRYSTLRTLYYWVLFLFSFQFGLIQIYFSFISVDYCKSSRNT